jgi:hypothetical protein
MTTPRVPEAEDLAERVVPSRPAVTPDLSVLAARVADMGRAVESIAAAMHAIITASGLVRADHGSSSSRRRRSSRRSTAAGYAAASVRPWRAASRNAPASSSSTRTTRNGPG